MWSVLDTGRRELDFHTKNWEIFPLHILAILLYKFGASFIRELRLKTGISVPPPPCFGTIAIGREHSETIDRGFSLVESGQLPLAANC